MKHWKLWILIAACALFYALFAVMKHLRLETNIFDLGYYDQLVWQVANGRGLYSSILEAHSWVDHVSPTLFLAVPLYWIFDSPLVLLILRPIIVCLGAYPLYKLSLKKNKNEFTALTISFAYLVFYGIQNALAFEFHPFVFAAPALAWLFWLYESRNWKWFWIALILLVGLQENFYLLGGAFGLFLILRYRDIKRGVFIMLGCAAMLLVLLKIIIPALGSEYYYTPDHLIGKSVTDLIAMLYTPSSKIMVVFVSFLAFAFLPVLTPSIFILLAEEFIGRFVMTPSINRWVLGYQYNATLAPIMAFGAIEAITHFFAKKQNLARILIITTTAISLLIASPDTKNILKKDFFDLSDTKNAYQILSKIPKDASVAATNNLGAQLAHRQGLIFLTNCRENSEVWGNDGKRCFNLKPEYIVADLSQGSGSNNYYPDYSHEALVSYLEILQKEKSYQLEEKVGEIYLLKKTN